MALKINKNDLLAAIKIQKEICEANDIDDSLSAIINDITELLHADRSTLFLIDEDEMQLQTKVAQGLGDEQIVVRMHMGIVGTAVLTNQGINLSDAHDNRYFEKSYDEMTGYSTESIIAIPVQDQSGAVIGAIEFLNHKDGQFSKQDEERIRAWSKTLTLFITNPATTFSETKEYVDEFVNKIGADRGTLFKLDPYTSHLISLYGTGLSEMPIILDLGLGVVGNVAVTGKTLVINDAQTDTRINKAIDDNTGYITKNLIAVPLLDSWNKLIGIIEVMNKKDDQNFDDTDINLLTLISRSISIAMENSILLREHGK